LTGKAFYEKVEGHPELTWLGIDKNEMVIVEHDRVGAKYELSLKTIQENTWEDLEDLFLGKRNPEIMKWQSRIVGYYSRIRGWNMSKREELKDRHRGQYLLPENTPDMDQTVPPEILEILAAGEDMVCKIPQLAEVA